jgi:hypothetical protein
MHTTLTNFKVVNQEVRLLVQYQTLKLIGLKSYLVEPLDILVLLVQEVELQVQLVLLVSMGQVEYKVLAVLVQLV